jgi:hypothetical protein
MLQDHINPLPAALLLADPKGLSEAWDVYQVYRYVLFPLTNAGYG